MTPAFINDCQHQLREHGEAIVRLDQQGKAQQASINDMRGDLKWILRGVVVVLLIVVANLLGLHG